jgi:5,10-methenyltetrahydrofolate synthetase
VATTHITSATAAPRSQGLRRRSYTEIELQVFNRFAFLNLVSLLPTDPIVADRRALRERLHRVRDRFVAESGTALHAALAGRLSEVLAELTPRCLGLYWPIRSEFNAVAACLADPDCEALDLALPYARKSPCDMHYRAWDRSEPVVRDECGIASTEGTPVVPDVVLVPCVGYTAAGHRLGYGGGYYDRWLAAHPQATAIGIAWSCTQIDETALRPQPHDQPLMLVVTERGVVD